MIPLVIPAAHSRTADALRAAAPPAIIAFAATLLLRFPPAQYSFYPRCPVHQLLHLQCPGCGATRAIADILRGGFGNDTFSARDGARDSLDGGPGLDRAGADPKLDRLVSVERKLK